MKKNRSIYVQLVSPSSLSSKQIEQICTIYLAHHHTTHEACVSRLKSGFDRMALFLDKETHDVVGFTGLIEKIQKLYQEEELD